MTPVKGKGGRKAWGRLGGVTKANKKKEEGLKRGTKANKQKRERVTCMKEGVGLRCYKKKEGGEGLLVWTCPAIMALSPAGTAQSALLWWGKRNNVV